MNKISTLFFGLALASVNIASADALLPEFQWSAELSTTYGSGDQCNGITSDKTGVYYYGTEGSQADGDKLYFNNDIIGDGAPTNSASAQANLVIVKTDNSGNRLWSITTRWGDVVGNEGGIVRLNDGTIVVVTKIRNSMGYNANGVEIIDGIGVSHKSSWNDPEGSWRNYRGFILLINSENGAIKTIREIVTGTTLNGKEEGIADGINLVSITTDGESVYFGGKYRSSLTFTTATGDVTLETHSLENWGGDTQNSNGNIFIAKIDKDGYLTKSFTSESPINLFNAMSLCYNNDRLFVTGMISGLTDGAEVKCGDKTITVGNKNGLYLAAMDTDFNVQWINSYKGAGVAANKTFIMQNMGLNVNGNDLWISGQANGKVLDAEGNVVFTTSKDSPREGILARFNAADGKPVAAVNSKDSYSVNALTGYLNVFTVPGDNTNVYVYGYGMNSTVGEFVRRYNVETLKSDPTTDNWIIMNSTGFITAQCMTYNPETTLLTASGRCNRAFTFIGTDKTQEIKGTGYGIVIGQFKMPFQPYDAIESIEGDNNGAVKVEGGYGEVTVSASVAAEVEIFDVTGRRVAVVSVDNSTASAALNPGLYITRYGKIVVR